MQNAAATVEDVNRTMAEISILRLMLIRSRWAEKKLQHISGDFYVHSRTFCMTINKELVTLVYSY